MANDAEKVLSNLLKKIQKNAKVRGGLAIAVVILLLGIAASFLYDILPRQYALTITGGEILSNRHHLAKSLQEEAADYGVSLNVVPTTGSQEALELLEAGKLDLAFIEGGLRNNYPHVVHVATIAPELFHFLVRPDIKDISELHGRLIDLGSKNGATRINAQQVLEFSGLVDGIDYVESNFSSEELVAMHAERLPDAVVIASFAPSDIAEYLVKQRGYDILEIPFPPSLGMRLGWVVESKILAYMYNVKPPVPARDIRTVGVNLHLVARNDVDPRAVFKVLESLFSHDLEGRLKMKFEESRLTIPSGFDMSEGTKQYLARNNPLLSSQTFDKIKSLFGLLLSIASTVMVIFKWFRGESDEPERPVTGDRTFLEFLGQVAGVENEFDEFRSQGRLTSDAVHGLQARLSAIKTDALALMTTTKLDDNHLPHSLLLAIANTRARIDNARVSQGSS